MKKSNFKLGKFWLLMLASMNLMYQIDELEVIYKVLFTLSS